MKVFLKMFLFASCALLIMVIMKLLDTYTSLKYEVDEPKAMQKISEALNDKEMYFKTLIAWLWLTFSYVIINIAILTRFLIRK